MFSNLFQYRLFCNTNRLIYYRIIVIFSALILNSSIVLLFFRFAWHLLFNSFEALSRLRNVMLGQGNSIAFCPVIGHVIALIFQWQTILHQNIFYFHRISIENFLKLMLHTISVAVGFSSIHGRFGFLPIAFRRRFTSIVLSNLPSTLTVTKFIISSFCLLAHEIVTLYQASGVNNGKRSTLSVKLLAL